ncbi:MAG: M48 family metalloprotease [Nitrospirae bacterium]|nr:M48 family metalloprotease [Nitrospirota bacterium]
MKPVVRKNIRMALFIILLLSAGCATVYNPATGKKEVIFIDQESQVAIGTEMAKRMEKEYPLYKNARATEYVNRIGQTVARAGDRPDLEYHFKILNIKAVNAFALPGGFVYVTKGLLNIANKDELAAVLGHEIGHIAARHGTKKLQTQLGYSLLSALIFQENNYKEREIARAANTAFNLISLGYSREDEFQADQLGTLYSYRAGYGLWGMLSFLKKLKKMEKQEPSLLKVFLSTHPPTSERIKVVEEEVKKLEQARVSK